MKIHRYFCHESGDQRTKARTFVRLNRLGSRLMIPLLSNVGPLAELKLLVTIESMTVAIGIPPHIRQAVLMKETLTMCKETVVEVQGMAATVKAAVANGFEEKALECGQMTGERMDAMLVSYHAKIEELIDK
jgi:hypothetical protein